MFKVILYDENAKLPEDNIFYIIAKNGIFMKKKLDLCESVVPVDKISILKEITPSIKFYLPKIGKNIIAPIVAFFRDVYKQYHSEAVVILHYSQKNKQYLIEVPKQKVSSASVKYKSEESFEGYNRVGTIHSHAGFSAFHSSVDVEDEKAFDGIHITFGDFSNSDKFSISVSAVVNGHRVLVEKEEYLTDIVEVKNESETISHTKYFTEVDGKWIEKKPYWSSKEFKTQYYNVLDYEKFKDYSPKWLDNVDEHTKRSTQSYIYRGWEENWHEYHSYFPDDFDHYRISYNEQMRHEHPNKAQTGRDYPNSSLAKSNTPPINVGVKVKPIDFPEHDDIDAYICGGENIFKTDVHRKPIPFKKHDDKKDDKSIETFFDDDVPCPQCSYREEMVDFVIQMLTEEYDDKNDDDVRDQIIDAMEKKYGMETFDFSDEIFTSPEEVIKKDFHDPGCLCNIKGRKSE